MNEYIPDKKMYAAVMGACSYIRRTGYFNKAVKYYSDKYSVDADKLAAIIRKRQGNGQRGKKRGTYKWFVVEEYTHHQWRDNYEEHEIDPYQLKVVRALSKENAGKVGEPRFGFQNECYSQWKRDVVSEAFCTESEAKAELDRIVKRMIDNGEA